VLNAVNGGFAIGIAGMVCFLPAGRSRHRSASSVGALQAFEVIALTEATRNVVVGAAADWRIAAVAAAAAAGGSGGAAAAALRGSVEAAARREAGPPRVAFDRSRIRREGGGTPPSGHVRAVDRPSFTRTGGGGAAAEAAGGAASPARTRRKAAPAVVAQRKEGDAPRVPRVRTRAAPAAAAPAAPAVPAAAAAS
jgi:hypothetical protein